ncbi:MAG: hypothetical protein ACPGEF_00430 [Endozoicomonas sp.]
MSKEEMLQQLIQPLIENAPDHSLTDMLDSAHKGFTHGANDFVEQQATENMTPACIKKNLRSYPLAQILISIIKYHELNKDTEIIRQTVLAILDSLETNLHPESYELQTLQATLH